MESSIKQEEKQVEVQEVKEEVKQDVNEAHRVLVSHIDAKVSNEQLETFFNYCGQIDQFSIAEEGDEKKVIIYFQTKESCDTCLLLNNTLIGDKKITVEMTSLLHSTRHDQIVINDYKHEDNPDNHTKTSIISSMLFKGYLLASDAFMKAVAYDKQHGISKGIKNALVSADEKTHFTEYVVVGAVLAQSGLEDMYVKVLKGIDHIDDKVNMSGALCNFIDACNKDIDHLKQWGVVKSYKIEQPKEIA